MDVKPPPITAGDSGGTQPVTARRRYPDAPLVGVAAAVFNAAGEVLLAKRSRPPRAGSWGLPGGLLDLGETLEDGARRVGTHRCTVSKGADGALVIEKTTGDRLHAETVAWEDGMTAFAGRTWIDGQSEHRYDPAHPGNAANDNYGNKVGLVLRSGERLFLISIDERGMTEPDPTYFEILELVPKL